MRVLLKRRACKITNNLSYTVHFVKIYGLHTLVTASKSVFSRLLQIDIANCTPWLPIYWHVFMLCRSQLYHAMFSSSLNKNSVYVTD